MHAQIKFSHQERELSEMGKEINWPIINVTAIKQWCDRTNRRYESASQGRVGGGLGVRGELTNMQTDTTLVEQGCTLKSPWVATWKPPNSRRGSRRVFQKWLFSATFSAGLFEGRVCLAAALCNENRDNVHFLSCCAVLKLKKRLGFTWKSNWNRCCICHMLIVQLKKQL